MGGAVGLPFAYAQGTARVKAVYLSVAWGSGQPFREVPCFPWLILGGGAGILRSITQSLIIIYVRHLIVRLWRRR